MCYTLVEIKTYLSETGIVRVANEWFTIGVKQDDQTKSKPISKQKTESEGIIL